MFAKVKDGVVVAFPYTVGMLRRDNSSTAFPKNIPEATMASLGMVRVTEAPAPEFDPLTHYVERGPLPVNEGGEWVLTMTVHALSDEQLLDQYTARATSIRDERDMLLRETDWMALSDNTMTPENAAYRQALRDITAQEGFPYEVTWPVKP